MGGIPWAKRERANCNQSKNFQDQKRTEVSRCSALVLGQSIFSPTSTQAKYFQQSLPFFSCCPCFVLAYKIT